MYLYRKEPTEFAVLKTQPTTRDGDEVNRYGLFNEKTGGVCSHQVSGIYGYILLNT